MNNSKDIVIRFNGPSFEFVLSGGICLLNYLVLITVVDLVLIMSVNPGFGGQSFIESQVKKIADLRRMCVEKVLDSHFYICSLWKNLENNVFFMFMFQGVNPWIEVDGGVGPKNAYKVPHWSHVLFAF